MPGEASLVSLWYDGNLRALTASRGKAAFDLQDGTNRGSSAGAVGVHLAGPYRWRPRCIDPVSNINLLNFSGCVGR